MKSGFLFLTVFVLPIALITGCTANKKYQWGVHDMNRPQPPLITPGELAGLPPTDAIVLFDGKDLSNWVTEKDATPAKWLVKDGFMQVVADTGNIRTKQAFGSCQLHIEWASSEQDAAANKAEQWRSNCGVFLMSRYEVQILDSYNNLTYADGIAGAMYGQNPPAANVCLKPGQWQTYDIIFHRPFFKDDNLVRPATVTVLYNGVLVQDNFKIQGSTVWKKRAKYAVHKEKEPLMLQDHSSPVRFRNIWIRELKECN